MSWLLRLWLYSNSTLLLCIGQHIHGGQDLLRRLQHVILLLNIKDSISVR